MKRSGCLIRWDRVAATGASVHLARGLCSAVVAVGHRLQSTTACHCFVGGVSRRLSWESVEALPTRIRGFGDFDTTERSKVGHYVGLPASLTIDTSSEGEESKTRVNRDVHAELRRLLGPRRPDADGTGTRFI
jgi:hypothetical protein